MSYTRLFRKPIVNTRRYKISGDTNGLQWVSDRMTHTEVLTEAWEQYHGKDSCNWLCIFDFGPRGTRQPKPVFFWAAPTYTPATHNIPMKPRRKLKGERQ